MSFPLLKPALGNTAWFPAVDGNWATLNNALTETGSGAVLNLGNLASYTSVQINTGGTARALLSSNTLALGASVASNFGLELGNTGGTATSPYIDFHSNATFRDFDARILCAGGSPTVDGQGTVTVYAGSIALNIGTVTSAVSFGSVSTSFGSGGSSTYGLEIGSVSTATTPYIDFHAGTAPDYDVRLQCTSGGTGTPGQGAFAITADLVSISNGFKVLGSAGIGSTPSGTGSFLVMAAASNPGTLANGQLWHDSTQKAYAAYTNGIKSWIAGLLYSQFGLVSVTATTATTLTGGTNIGTRTLPANFLVLNKVIRIRAAIIFTAGAASASTTLTVKLGSGSFSLQSSAISSKTLSGLLEVTLIPSTVSASGVVTYGATLTLQDSSNATVSIATSVGTMTSVDATGSLAVDIQGQVSTTTNAPVVKSQLITIEAMA